ncbi:MAG: hypothetical protein GY725_25965 [bacterium]|nr:hypothetical protein [bacterium]
MSTIVKTVGLLCNCTMDTDPIEQLSPSLVNRAFLISEQLEPLGIGIFLYSPKDVTGEGEVPGYRVEGRGMVRDRYAVPRINANWTYGTRKLINQGMGYRRFKNWVRKNDIAVYVPYEFSELVSNKLKTYHVVREFDTSLHPHTEDFIGSAAQLNSFLDRSNLAFVKPRAGNKGNQIFVFRKDGSEISMKYYDYGTQRIFSPITLESAVGMVNVAGDDKKYVVQQGIESLRFKDSVFDIRVVMVNDGNDWHSLMETRLAPVDSDVSNIFQGGSIRVSEDLFKSLFGAEAGRTKEREIRRVSHDLAKHLEGRFPGELIEIGLDIILDTEGSIHLIEINSKPGVSGIGSETKLFDWKEEDEPFYDKWVRPQMRHLAGFLASKTGGS